MKFNKKLAVAVSGAVLLMAGQIALADSTTDIVDALVSKGVLTEEEGKLISKGAKSQKEAQDKTIKGKLSISGALENATLYGDIRARYERRSIDIVNTGVTNGQNQETNRSRYKITLGVETKSGDWYSDFAMAMSSNGRSDNTTFGDSGTGALLGAGDVGMSPKDKSALYVKRAMIGWSPTDWLSVEVGRTKNPLYMVNSMVFDHDIVMEGAQEKLKYKLGDTNLFANFGQWVYSGAGVQALNDVVTSGQTMVIAFQGGAQQAFIDNKLSGKAAIGWYDYTQNNPPKAAAFQPIIGNGVLVNSAVAGAGYSSDKSVNYLAILDIPAELNYMAMENIGLRAYGEYAYNTRGNDRKAAACLNNPTYCGLDNDDTAWLVGLSVGSAKDLKSFEGKKMAKGDWFANLWYQSVGIYALDQNAVDTDIFDGRINMEGTSLKAQYNVLDNVALNVTGAWGKRKNGQYGTNYSKADISSNGDNFDLYQFDVTYKF